MPLSTPALNALTHLVFAELSDLVDDSYDELLLKGEVLETNAL